LQKNKYEFNSQTLNGLLYSATSVTMMWCRGSLPVTSVTDDI